MPQPSSSLPIACLLSCLVGPAWTASVFDPPLDVAVAPVVDHATQLDLADFGADHSGATLCDTAFANAIAAAEAAGGARILVPAGSYTVTRIALASDVHLHLADGAIIRASNDPAHYQRRQPLITGHGLERIAITGTGRIVGGAELGYGAEPGHRWSRTVPHSRSPLFFMNCREVVVEGVTVTDAVGWTVQVRNCERVRLSGVTIRNPTWAERENTDGIDIVGSRHVLVEDCDIVTGDDGVCIKTLDFGRDAEPDRSLREVVPAVHDVWIRRCRVASTCNATKIGTETAGDIYRVLFEDITIVDHPNVPRVGGNPRRNGTTVAAFTAQSSDGGHVYDIVARGYRVAHCYAPIFLLLQDRDNRFDEPTAIGRLGTIRCEDFVVDEAEAPIHLQAAKGHYIDGVVLANLRITSTQQRTFASGFKRPRGGYPGPHKVGKPPCWGLFARGVKKLQLTDPIVLTHRDPSIGPPVHIEDCPDRIGTIASADQDQGAGP